MSATLVLAVVDPSGSDHKRRERAPLAARLELVASQLSAGQLARLVAVAEQAAGRRRRLQ